MQAIGKKVIALLLAVAMLCVVPVIGAQAEETFSSQLKTDIGLFRIDDPHKAGQEFVLDFAQMQTVRAYLEMESPNTTVTVSIHSNVNEDPVRSQSFTFPDALNGWVTMTMDEPLSLTAGERYSLVLTSNAKVIWKGVPRVNSYNAWNYDAEAYGGWNQEPYSTAFEILPPPASWEVVTQSIAALPDEITLDNADAVAAVRRAYDALSESDKALVANYERLTAAEAVIANLQQLIYTSQSSAPNALFQCRAPSGGGQEFRPDFANLTKVTSWLEIQQETDITLTIWKGYPHEGAVTLYSQTYHMAQQPAGWIEFVLSEPVFLEEQYGKYVFMISSTGSVLMFGTGGQPHPSGCWAINGENGGAVNEAWHTGFSVEGTQAEDYQKLIRKINQLPDAMSITLADEAAIAALMAEYAALPVEAQQKVSNYSVLENAQAIIDFQKLLKLVEDLVADIGKLEPIDQLTLNDAPTVAALRERYNNLPEGLPQHITNYEVLTAAEVKIAELQEADRGYQALIQKIDAMPYPLTIAKKSLVDELMAQYNALSPEDQQKVTNYSKLSKAQDDMDYVTETLAFPEDSPFTHQTINTDGLYLLTAPDHAGGQQFIPDFDELTAVAAYLEIAANNVINVTIAQKSAEKQDGSDQIMYASEDFAIDNAVTGWVEFRFEKPVAVTQGETYEIIISSSERAVWMGKLNLLPDNTMGCRSLVYDLPTYGGWGMGPHSNAFQAVGTQIEAYQLLINKIASLPSEITLSHENTVNSLLREYNNLSPEDQSKVSNYNVLDAALKRIEELKNDVQGLAIQAAIDAISALDSTVTLESEAAIRAVLDKVKSLVTEYGEATLKLVTNCDKLLTVCSDYNKLVHSLTIGDINNDGKIDAADALLALQHSVQLIELTGTAARAAKVNTDDQIDASDALMILQYSVNLIDTFPVQLEELDVHFLLQSEKNKSLFNNTRQSMFDRTTEDGYASTSVTGAYPGMFVRDTSIQILSHVECGDWEQARKILNYTFAYHEPYNFAIHVMDQNPKPISMRMQADTTFFLLHAWYQYAANAPDSPEKREFIERYTDKVKIFASYYFISGYYNEELCLLRNPSLEHSREGSYFNCYDLLTNVYASQALHELALYFKDSAPEDAAMWAAQADEIVQGIHKNLIAEVDGKTVYAEMQAIDKIYSVTGEKTDDDKFYIGFSWVNLAPMGAHWYAMDEQIMDNTYDRYMEYGSALYYNKYQMLEAAMTYQSSESYHERAVIGKGLAWEIMYCYDTGRYDRVRELIHFLEDGSNDMYREGWHFAGGGSDTANQEHANWMILANQYVCRFIEF